MLLGLRLCTSILWMAGAPALYLKVRSCMVPLQRDMPMVDYSETHPLKDSLHTTIKQREPVCQARNNRCRIQKEAGKCAGQKRQLRWLRHYLASVTTSILPRAVTTTALHVYDLRNKLVAASVTLPQVRAVGLSICPLIPKTVTLLSAVELCCACTPCFCIYPKADYAACGQLA